MEKDMEEAVGAWFEPHFLDVSSNSNDSLLEPMYETYMCIYCNQELPNNESLKAHTDLHLKSGNYSSLTGEQRTVIDKCKVCKKQFPTEYALTKHMRKHNEEALPFGCNICDRRFASKQALSYHLSTHANKKTISCPICNIKLVTKQSLTFHMSTHTGSKEFKCEKCNRPFTTRHAMKYHMKTCSANVIHIDD